MATYKWASPYAWYLDKLTSRSWSYSELTIHLGHFLGKLDADTIQEYFQDEMETDGYFEPDCQHKFTHRVGNTSGIVDYCVDCKEEL